MRRHSPVSIPAVLTLLIGLLISVLLFASLRRLAHDNAEIEFQQRAQSSVAAIQSGLNNSLHVLANVNQMFATFEHVSRTQFKEFVTPLLARNQHIQALSFRRAVQASERADYETQMRAIFPGFSITERRGSKLIPAGQRETYWVVHYLEPLTENYQALGYDAASHPVQRQMMRRMVEHGRIAATSMLRLAQDENEQRSFIVSMPVYREGAGLSDAMARRAALVGDTAAVFRGPEMIRASLAMAGNEVDFDRLDIKVYAAPVSDPQALIYGAKDPVFTSSHSIPGLPDWLFYDEPGVYEKSLVVAGQTWLATVEAPAQFFFAHDRNALWVLLLGVLCSLVIAIYLQRIVTRAHRNQMLVNERTMQLRLANQDLLADIAARRHTEQALQLRERAIEASANSIVITSAEAPEYGIEYVNPAFERITGYTESEVVGRSICFLWKQDLAQTGIGEIQSSMREQREGHAMLRTYRKDGTLFWSDVYVAPVRDERGEVSHYVMAQYDVTKTKRYESALEFQTNRDSLTGLPNRTLLNDRLGQAISYASRYGYSIWVLFIDLDRFKFVNDTLGLPAGDVLLKEVATRMNEAVRDTDTIARMSSDEFVIVLPERNDAGLNTGIVTRIMDAIAQPMTIEGHELFISCSVGVAVYPADGDVPETLIKHADIAMYRAKELGRNNFQFFTSEMNERALERLRLEGDLRLALERDEFELHYQPQVDLVTGDIVGVEALIRWSHPELGMVPPTRFISLAEETGLIVPIGNWVLAEACRQTRLWLDAGFASLHTAINLSARQFAETDLVQVIAAALMRSGLPPSSLEIELTESLVMADVDHAIGVLRELKTLGVQLSIDDFGTGYSSLSYLKRFPIDVLKIDRSFVNDITTDSDDAAIVSSIISLAHSLRLKVVAEGVETAEQLEYLRQHGCDLMQGYYFSKPLTATAMTQMLHDRMQQSLAGGDGSA